MLGVGLAAAPDFSSFRVCLHVTPPDLSSLIIPLWCSNELLLLRAGVIGFCDGAAGLREI